MAVCRLWDRIVLDGLGGAMEQQKNALSNERRWDTPHVLPKMIVCVLVRPWVSFVSSARLRKKERRSTCKEAPDGIQVQAASGKPSSKRGKKGPEVEGVGRLA